MMLSYFNIQRNNVVWNMKKLREQAPGLNFQSDIHYLTFNKLFGSVVYMRRFAGKNTVGVRGDNGFENDLVAPGLAGHAVFLDRKSVV